MLAERPATDLALPQADRTADRGMLILQYAMAVVAMVAAFLLAGVN